MRITKREEQIRLKEGGDTYRSDCMIVLRRGRHHAWRRRGETAASGIPLLGVNLGTVGYLAEVEPLALDLALEKLLREEYTIEERMTLSGRVLREDGSGERRQVHALNDVTITRRGPLQIIQFRIWVNGQVLNSYGAGWHCHCNSHPIHRLQYRQAAPSWNREQV